MRIHDKKWQCIKVLHGVFVILAVSFAVLPVQAKKLVILVSDANTEHIRGVKSGLKLPKRIEFDYAGETDLKERATSREFVAAADVIVIDVMISELVTYLLENVDLKGKTVYAVRGSRDDSALIKEGFVFDDDIKAYYKALLPENLYNLVKLVCNREFDTKFDCAPPKHIPDIGISHPSHDGLFETSTEYLAWLKQSTHYTKDAPWVAVTFFSSFVIPGQQTPLRHVINQLETAGCNVIPVFGWGAEPLNKFLLSKDAPAIGAIVAFNLKFKSAMNEQVKQALHDINAPIFNVQNLYYSTIEAYRKDPEGLRPMEVVWAISTPELSGLIEPTVVSGQAEHIDPETNKKWFTHEPVRENVGFMVKRVKKLLALQRKANQDKKVAIIIYNHSQGKQNVGASYLNVFRSLQQILKRMDKEGYNVGDNSKITEEKVKEMILRSARNIGSWAPGELENLLKSDEVVRVPISTYQQWLASRPDDYGQKVLEQWGEVTDTAIMRKGDSLIIPSARFGNICILPEPARGWGDDAMKLYHSPEVYPHHQYNAAYWWLSEAYQADALIHLGTHATYEWLPGKQTGLSPSCPPAVMSGDIPNIYPYTVDDVGEGIQAKRRGYGVMIDHLTPAVKKSGLYSEYAELKDLIGRYERNVQKGSQSAEGYLEQIIEMIQELGLDRDLGLESMDQEAIEEVEHYMEELADAYMPYGMHTFGVSPKGEALSETLTNIVEGNDKVVAGDLRKNLVESGPNEMDKLLKGLSGEYVPAGEGNDPLRNPEAIPTGRNFYGFDPAKLPSKAAYNLGCESARQMISAYRKKHNRYPSQIALVLWATETMRNEGINESTALCLLGLRPKWNNSGRVTGVEVVPGKELGRPRIDVLLDASGLYRDQLPNLMRYLDKAVKIAAQQTDIENFLAKHAKEIKAELKEKGFSEEDADNLSKARLFSEKIGAYGTGVSEVTAMSGFWEEDDEIADVFINHVGYVFTEGAWGEEAKNLLKTNLKRTDVTAHSMSSAIYGVMDNDDMFQYLGGLSLAVRKESGKVADTLIVRQQGSRELQVESAAQTVGGEMRTRYLNPKWLEGAMKEDYAGAKMMSDFAEYLWGWQVTVPESVDERAWKQVYDVYVKDKHGMDVPEFMDKANPWAQQSMNARMLEAIRKNYWDAQEDIQQELAAEYATSVVKRGVACCDHTCNNPMLNQMVVNLISVPGVMAPEMVQEFKIAIEKATQQTLEEHAEAIKQEHARVIDYAEAQSQQQDPEKQANREQPDEAQTAAGEAGEAVEGLKMEEVKNESDETAMSSSGVQWFAVFIVLGILAVFGFGMLRQNHRNSD